MLLRGGKVVMTSQLIMTSQLVMTSRLVIMSQLVMMKQPSFFFVSKIFKKSRLIEVAAYTYSTRMLLLLIRNGILIHKII